MSLWFKIKGHNLFIRQAVKIDNHYAKNKKTLLKLSHPNQ